MDYVQWGVDRMESAIGTIISLIQAVLQWFADFAFANPWATFAFVALGLFAGAPSFRFTLWRSFRGLGLKSFKASGVEVAFDVESRKLIEEDFNQAISAIKAFRQKGQLEISRNVASLGIDSLFRAAAAEVFEKSFGDRLGGGDLDARAVIHIPDFVSSNRLLQLVDYYPKGKGAGRTFSHRSGIIGRVWRSGTGASAGGLLKRVYEAEEVGSNTKEIQDIQLEWGLTLDEAQHYASRQSYCCVPIRKSDRVLGIFYIDASRPNFGWGTEESTEVIINRLDQLQSFSLERIAQNDLVDALIELEGKIGQMAPRIVGEF